MTTTWPTLPEPNPAYSSQHWLRNETGWKLHGWVQQGASHLRIEFHRNAREHLRSLGWDSFTTTNAKREWLVYGEYRFEILVEEWTGRSRLPFPKATLSTTFWAAAWASPRPSRAACLCGPPSLKSLSMKRTKPYSSFGYDRTMSG